MSERVDPTTAMSTSRTNPGTEANASRDRTGRSDLRIGILAHVGMGNFGDELMFASVVRNLERRCPGADLVGFAGNPENAKKWHGLRTAHPIRPPRPDGDSETGRIAATLGDVRRELAFARVAGGQVDDLDALVFAGSGQFNDNYGGWRGYPLTLFRWTSVGRVKGVPVFFLSMGAQPLSSSISEWLTRATVSMSSYVSVRDPSSRENLLEVGVARDVPVLPDLAFGHPVPASDSRADTRDGASARVGINPIPSFHPSWRESDGASYSTYIEALTELACASLRDGHEVVLYSTHARDDSGAMDDIVEGVAGHLGSRAADDIAAPAVASLDDVWNTISGLRWVVASRYHGVITALMMGKPTLALAYRRKTSDLAKMLGLEETCIPIPHVTAGNLLDRFGRLTADDAKFAAAARRGVRSLRSRIDGQFDMVCERARG